MAAIKQDRFSGIAPAIAPRKLADQYATVAQNVDFESGALVPLEADTFIMTVPGDSQSIYLEDSQVLSWKDAGVSVARGPVPNDVFDRYYWTDGAYPKLTRRADLFSGIGSEPSVHFRLGIPAPENPPIFQSKAGTAPTEGTPTTAVWVYTFVSIFGEEGPPSPVSAPQTYFPGDEQITFSLSPSGSDPTVDNPKGGSYAFGSGAKMRLYRANPGSNLAEFQFVAEIGWNGVVSVLLEDAKGNDELAEILPSATWEMPPNDNVNLYPDGPLQGLVALANGIFVGFTGKRLCLSESYLPHAWPIDYRITLDRPIIAIAAVSNGVICATEGRPYFVTGSDPSAMTAVQIDLSQPCLSARSVVDMGEYVMYCGVDGLCLVEGSTGRVVTRGLVEARDWRQNFHPDKVIAFRHKGTYVAFWGDDIDYGGWIYDPRSDAAALSNITIDMPVRGGTVTEQDGVLYYITSTNLTSTGGQVWAFATANIDRRMMAWTSKVYTLPKPAAMSWLVVRAPRFPVYDPALSYAEQPETPISIVVTIDGKAVGTYKFWEDTTNNTYRLGYTLNEVGGPGVYTQGASAAVITEPNVRLPAREGMEFTIRVSADVEVTEVAIATSIEEIRAL